MKRNYKGELITDLEEYLEEEEEQEEEGEEEGDDPEGEEEEPEGEEEEGDDPEEDEEPEPSLADMFTNGDLEGAKEYIRQRSIDAVKSHIG